MAGRAAVPADERQAVKALLRRLDFHGQELRITDAELARVALGLPGAALRARDGDPGAH